jgi:hypothetical protein
MFDFENGINGATGKYLFPSLSAAEIANIFKADLDRSKNLEAHRNELKERAKLKFDSKAPAAWVDPTDLSQSGWGVIFANEYHPYTIEQLKSDDGIGLLLKHRRHQATQQNDRYYRECTYQPTWDKSKFLTQHKVPASGAIDPDRGMPYYLLIVGDPASIPYDFQSRYRPRRSSFQQLFSQSKHQPIICFSKPINRLIQKLAGGICYGIFQSTLCRISE